MIDHVTDVYIGVGSNTDPTAHIAQALKRMRAKFGPLVVSDTYRNAAVGFAGEDFLNLVVGFRSDRELATVVRDLLEIELLVGKDFSTPRLSSQIIDLDLLLFGDLVLRTDRLEIPRPETLTETYCLRPLAELCPDRTHPTAGATFADLWRRHDRRAMERFDWQCVVGEASRLTENELRINDLRVEVNLGVGETERSQPQEVALSLAIAFAHTPTACGDDEIAGTVDYAHVCDCLTELCTSREFKTIEHLAQACFDNVCRLLADTQCSLTVEVHKCRPPIADLQGGTTFVMKYGK